MISLIAVLVGGTQLTIINKLGLHARAAAKWVSCTSAFSSSIKAGKDGKLGRMVKNPTYTGIGPVFWGSLDRLAGGDEWVHWGTPNCGKGQPMQVAHTGHSAAPGRFKNVRVGVRG